MRCLHAETSLFFKNHLLLFWKKKCIFILNLWMFVLANFLTKSWLYTHTIFHCIIPFQTQYQVLFLTFSIPNNYLLWYLLSRSLYLQQSSLFYLFVASNHQLPSQWSRCDVTTLEHYYTVQIWNFSIFYLEIIFQF